jgi:hypothetical protein
MDATIRRCSAKRVSALAGVWLLVHGAIALPDDSSEVHRICAGELLVFDEPDFAVFDVDTDAVLSEDETDTCTALQVVFDELDLDADEALTEQEYLSFPQIWRQRKDSFGASD